MKRYCIVCKEQFGCVVEGVKYRCDECLLRGKCPSRGEHPKSVITGGICETCWGNRRYIKTALKIHDIAHRLDLKPKHGGLRNLAAEIPYVFSRPRLLSLV